MNKAIVVMKKTIVVIVIVIIVEGLAIALGCYICPRTGSHSGRVIDAVTGEAISGAVVSYWWDFSGVFMNSSMLARCYETTTDQDGRYFVPARRVIRKHLILDGSLEPESVLIYKDGYAVYKLLRPSRKPPVSWSFGYPDEGQIYQKKDNIVKLYPWKEGESHEDHVLGIDCYGGSGVLLRKELKKEEQRAREQALSKDEGE